MGRRSDHGREELEALILATGREVMDLNGYARFSAREVAKRIGYSVGTVMHVFGNVDRFVMAINAQTFGLWTLWLENRLDGTQGRERILVLVRGYFEFAASHRNLWSAIYEHRVPDDVEMIEALVGERRRLTGVIAREVTSVLPPDARDSDGAIDPAELAASLIATVHGHCAFLLGGTFDLLGIGRPAELAAARVMETLRASGAMLDD